MKTTSFIENSIKSTELIFSTFLLLMLILSITSCERTQSAKQKSSTSPAPCQIHSESSATLASENGSFHALKSKAPVKIDGCNNDAIWSKIDWYDMNYLWMGNKVDLIDYHGRFKLAWDNQHLYILVEVIDEKLNPTLGNGKENYWKGDYVEVFIDEDKSGGNHQYNHQAFAYHVSTEGHAIDKNTLQETVFFDDHIDVERSQEGNKHIWEMAIKIYDKNFDENSSANTPVKLNAQKSIGFSIAYGDNDGNNSRENFMGSKKTHGTNNDEGYVNSDVFGSIMFIE